MSRETLVFDVVVAGAGTSGAAAAAFLAEAGLRVAMIERRPWDKGGARWINAVPGWVFDRVGVGQPVPPELHGVFGTGSFRSPQDSASIELSAVPIWDVDMRSLGDRLRQRALDAGVTVFDRVDIERLHLRDGRPRAVEIARFHPRGSGRRHRLDAALFVDATGLAGALRTRVPALQRDCPPVPPQHSCTAASCLHRIADRDGARRFLDRHGLEPGRSVTWLSVTGGFSTLIVSIDEALEEVSFVTGTIADGRHPTGPELLERSRREFPWVGEPRFGGEGVIPLRRPYDRLTAPGVALVGDAGCQVFSTHGSGVGNGMIAARILADTVAGATDPGDPDLLWGYQAAYQRERGAQSAPFDVFRRLSQTWTPDDVEDLLSADVLSPNLWAEGILQRLAPPDMDAAQRGIRCALHRPRVVAALGPHVARMYAVHGIYRVYPRVPDRRLLRAWSRAAAMLFGEGPEIRS